MGLAGKRVIGLIDSGCVLDALIKGQSQKDDVQKLIKCFSDLVAEHNILLYLDRVSSDTNPADGMSRDGEEEAKAMGWRVDPVVVPDWLP